MMKNNNIQITYFLFKCISSSILIAYINKQKIKMNYMCSSKILDTDKKKINCFSLLSPNLKISKFLKKKYPNSKFYKDYNK